MIPPLLHYLITVHEGSMIFGVAAENVVSGEGVCRERGMTNTEAMHGIGSRCIEHMQICIPPFGIDLLLIQIHGCRLIDC